MGNANRTTILRMAFGRVFAVAMLLGSSVMALGDAECSADGECGSEESSLLALRGEQDLETRRRLPPITCINKQGNKFKCAGGNTCCVGACVDTLAGDICCINVNGDGFPCCGNACFSPGSKCCQSAIKPRSQWYPVTQATQC